MWTVHVILPRGVRFTITSHGVVVIGVWLAMALVFGSYVSTLHASVQRGERLRAEQVRVATAQPIRKTAAADASFAHTATAKP